MSSKRYSLKDLEQETGFDPRTIRLYIEKGLMQGAEGRGPKAAYRDHHLNRLRFIKVLRDQLNLSLAQIGQAMVYLDEDTIRAVGTGQEKVSALTLDPGGASESVARLDSEPTSALDYIRQVRMGEAPEPMFGSARRRTWPGRPVQDPGGRSGASRLERLARVLEDTTRRDKVQRRAKGEVWVSIPVLPDIEIRARGMGDEDLIQLERIADLLRQILLDEIDDSGVK